MNHRDLTSLPGTAIERLDSKLDYSVNYVFRNPAIEGVLEARYVRRAADYFVVYLSSQTGCAQACRFCHLTHLGETHAIDASIKDLVTQAELVCRHHESTSVEANVVHFNFMARGEPLACKTILKHGEDVCRELSALARSRRLIPRIKISTIMPQALATFDLIDLFPVIHPDIYYSLYSTAEEFRRRWLPRALPVSIALKILATYQRRSRKIPVIHYALIDGENDSRGHTQSVCDSVKRAGLRCDFNLVHYNPASDRLGTASKEHVVRQTVDTIMQNLPDSTVKCIKPVGFDVKASCGMFVDR